MAAAMQLQRDAALMASNLQVLGQYVTSLNRMSSEVMRLAFGPELFPSEAVDAVAPVLRVHRAALQVSAIMGYMGLWRPPVGPGLPGLMPVSACHNCMNCVNCLPEKSG